MQSLELDLEAAQTRGDTLQNSLSALQRAAPQPHLEPRLSQQQQQHKIDISNHSPPSHNECHAISETTRHISNTHASVPGGGGLSSSEKADVSQRETQTSGGGVSRQEGGVVELETMHDDSNERLRELLDSSRAARECSYTHTHAHTHAQTPTHTHTNTHTYTRTAYS